MEINITPKILVDLAAAKHGSLGELARSMDKNATRISEWKSGKQKPDASEIAYLADCAGLPVFETVGMIQMQLDNRFTSIWQAALNKLHDVDHASDWRKR